MRRRFGAGWLAFAVLGLGGGCFAEVPDADFDGTNSETGDGDDSRGDSGADSSSDSVTSTDDRGDDDPGEEGDSHGDSGSSGSADDDDSEDSEDGSDGPSGEDSSGSEDSGSGDSTTDTDTDDGGSGSTSDSGDTADAGDDTGDTGDGGTGTGDTGDGGNGTGDTGDGGTGTGDTGDGGTGTSGTGTPPDPCCLGLVCGMDCSMSCGTCTDYCSVDQTLCAKTWGYPEPFTEQWQLEGNYIVGYRILGTIVPARVLRLGLIGGDGAGGSNVRIGLYDTVFDSGDAYPNNLVAASDVFALTPGRHELEVDAELTSADGYWLLVATSGNDYFSYEGGTPGTGDNAAIWYEMAAFSMPAALGSTAGVARDPNYQEVDFNWYAVFE